MNILSPEYKQWLLIDFWTLHKIIRASDHIIQELVEWKTPLTKCQNHVIAAVEGLHETDAIPFEVVCLIYDGIKDTSGSVFRLLENYLLENYVFDMDTSSSVNIYTRDKVYSNYKQLGELLWKPVNENLSNYTNPLYLTDQRDLSLILESPTLEVLSILIAQTHKTTHENYSRESATELDDYLNYLYKRGVLLEPELIDAISTNDIDRTLYEIFKEKIFWNIIPEGSYLFECFLEFETKYKKEKIHNLTKSITDEAIDLLEDPLNPRLFSSLVSAFEFDIIELFDFEELMELLSEDWIITPREESYFRTMSSHSDIVHYLITVLENDTHFWEQLSYSQSVEIKKCFDAFHLTYWEKHSFHNSKTNMTLSLIESLSSKLVTDLLSEREITHDFLNDFLHRLVEYMSQRSYYMGIIHIGFDELYEIPTTFNKALQILWILFCDIIDAHFPYFEDISELLLVNIRSESTHAAIKNFYTQKKALNNNPTSP